MNFKPYLNQDYEKLKAECIKNGKLFEDDQFPASAKSIGKYRAPSVKISWKRPHEIFSDPQFVVNSFDSKDLDQGVLGNCWFIAAVIALADNADFIKLVVPDGQTFDKTNSSNDYCGIFHFRIWKYGDWYDCVVDDRLPCDSKDQLFFCRNSRLKHELWAPLLEKAYAKMASCYEFLDGGLTQDSMIDLTGGCEEVFDLQLLNKTEIEFLWKALSKSFLFKSICTASIFSNHSGESREAIKKNGLVAGHAYSITKLIEVTKDNKAYFNQRYNQNQKQIDFDSNIKLLRLRNPWGNHIEWNGRYSDKSDDWKAFDEKFKKEIGLVFDKEGEFWISYEDFLANIDSVTLVHVNLNAFSPNDTNRLLNWNTTSIRGAWIKNKNSGGSRTESYWLNPQYILKLRDSDLDDDDNKVTVIVSLMQTDTIKRRDENEGEYDEEPIQFRFYRILNQSSVDCKIVDREHFTQNELELVGHTGPYVPFRTVSKRFRVDEGFYLIIPSTYDKEKNVNFLLRVFTEYKQENNYEPTIFDIDCNKDDKLRTEEEFNIEKYFGRDYNPYELFND